MTKKFLHFYLLFLIFPTFGLKAQEVPVSPPILIVGAHLEGRLDGTADAGYDQLVKLILPEDGSIEFQRMPLVRAIRTFADEKSVCLFPTSISAVRSIAAIPDEDFLQSVPIDFVSSHVMTPHGRQTVNSFDDMNGLRIAVQRGVDEGAVSKSLSKPIIVKTPNDTTALRMMLAGQG